MLFSIILQHAPAFLPSASKEFCRTFTIFAGKNREIHLKKEFIFHPQMTQMTRISKGLRPCVSVILSKAKNLLLAPAFRRCFTNVQHDKRKKICVIRVICG